MLTIRLQRIGKKKFPTYRLIVNEKGRDTHDRYLEQLGSFNPHAKENQFKPAIERIQYWLSKGATTSDTIHNLLVSAGVVKDKKKKSVFLSRKRSAKINEKNKAAADAKKAAEEKAASDKKAAAEAAAQAAEAAKAAAEAPAPETPAAEAPAA